VTSSGRTPGSSSRPWRSVPRVRSAQRRVSRVVERDAYAFRALIDPGKGMARQSPGLEKGAEGPRGWRFSCCQRPRGRFAV